MREVSSKVEKGKMQGVENGENHGRNQSVSLCESKVFACAHKASLVIHVCERMRPPGATCTPARAKRREGAPYCHTLGSPGRYNNN